MNTDAGDNGEHRSRKRLGGGHGGAGHLAGRRADERDLRNRRVSDAIKALEATEPERFPDVNAILEHADGTITRNRVYDEKELMYAAQSRWNRREEAAGREGRKLRGGDRRELDDWVPKADLEDANAHLRRAIEEIRDLRARNERLSGENSSLKMDRDRLEAGIYDEIWPPKKDHNDKTGPVGAERSTSDDSAKSDGGKP